MATHSMPVVLKDFVDVEGCSDEKSLMGHVETGSCCTALMCVASFHLVERRTHALLHCDVHPDWTRPEDESSQRHA